MTAAGVRRTLAAYADPVRAQHSRRYFKTGPGDYGEGDRFIGVTVPDQRRVVREFRELPLVEVDRLLTSAVHEERAVALMILVSQFDRAASTQSAPRESIFRLYMRRLRHVNNWDLVDTSAPGIVGGWLSCPAGMSQRRALLERLARSTHLWSRRVAMIATFRFIVDGEHQDAVRIATILINDSHDLIQKAVGWMLREVGKRASPPALEAFLTRHAATMPRTSLRYAIERFTPRRREYWMALRSPAIRTNDLTRKREHPGRN